MHEFPSLISQVDQLIDRFAKTPGIDPDQIEVVVSPYRICPIGAHVDHQGGDVLGKTINAYTLMAFVPNNQTEIKVSTLNYPGTSTFMISNIGPPDYSDWSRYARGAAKVLDQYETLQYGLTGLVSGTLPGSGLSSSASVGLAYLKALATVNRIALTPAEYIELDRQIENNYLGLSNGIQDQSAIVNGRKDQLMHLNTVTRQVDQISDAKIPDHAALLIVYSGYSRELTSTGFNDRVSECRAAARMMGVLMGQESDILSDIPLDAYDALKAELPEQLQRRAAHYYSEVARVQAGRKAWADGDIEQFGALMNQSCESSIHQYQSGSEPIIALQQIVHSAPGVYGSRFGGGGYGGCVLGFVELYQAPTAIEEIRWRYESRFPAAIENARYHLATFEDNLRLFLTAIDDRPALPHP